MVDIGALICYTFRQKPPNKNLKGDFMDNQENQFNYEDHYKQLVRALSEELDTLQFILNRSLRQIPVENPKKETEKRKIIYGE